MGARVFVGLLVAACGTEDVDPPTPTVFDRLQERPIFILWGAELETTVRVRLDGGVDQPARLELLGGHLSVAGNPDGALVVETFDLWYDSLRAGSGGLPPSGLHLTDLHIYQGQSSVCDDVQWTEGGETCAATANTALLFEAVFHASDGVEVPIGPEPLGAMGLDMFFFHELAEPGDRPMLTTDLRALAPGSLGELGHGFELLDLSLEGTAREMVPLSQ